MKRSLLLLGSICLAIGVAAAADAKKKKPAPTPTPAAKPTTPTTPAPTTPTAKAPAATPAAGPAAPVLTAEQTAFFENRIRPILNNQCLRCHSAAEGKVKGGLALDTREGALKGGDSGPSVVPGNPDKSVLIKAIRYTDANLQMPPKGEKLSDQQIADFVSWVKMGAPDPRSGTAKGKYASASERKVWWAFQPIKKQEPPKVGNPTWPANAVDNFILAKLEEKNLKPSAPAERRVLIRRVYFDLTGLPPSPEEVEVFVDDKSADAYEKLVDKLLASPHYGERWGRHWLDVARYSDTIGDPAKRAETPAYPFAWTYRDYVIKAFNDDKPYDLFIREQIAADRIPGNKDRTSLAALGFLSLGDHFNGNKNDIINDRIDVTTKAFNGLTVACARCHDHMFDPIPTKDYYALHGIFSSTAVPRELPFISGTQDKAKYQDYVRERAAIEKEQADIAAQLKAKGGAKNNKKELQKETLQLKTKLDRLDLTHPGAPIRAMAVEDVEKPHDSPVFIRGEADNKGDLVPRRYLEIFRSPTAKPFTYGSGRLELSYAIANKSNPLTSRVMINRVWQHHFGEGFVLTPDDFGTMSTPPSHPELLDFLSSYFMDNGWSVKKLHKLILLSNTYQQASTDNPRFAQTDPYNRLLWRQNVRRLEFEPLRDSILAMSGALDRTVGGRPVNLGEGPGAAAGKEKNAKMGATLKPTGNYSNRRTLYGYVDRAHLAEVMNHFDFASPEMPNGHRYTTTVPQQALFLMNNPLVIEQARRIVERKDFTKLEDDERRVEYLYSLLYQRLPSPQEIQLGLAFFEEAPAKTTALPAAPASVVAQAPAVKVAAAKGKLPLPQAAPRFTPRPLTAWAEYAHALILANEFTFVN